MSIDLYVLPTDSVFLFCKELKDKFWQLLDTESKKIVNELRLLEGNPKVEIKENEQLNLINKDYKIYYPSFNIPTTLTISIDKNESKYLYESSYELDYLEDFGRNLSSEKIINLAEQWKCIGYTYGLTTYAGRARYERPLFTTLATSIAYLCKGYIIVMSDDFTLDVGVYTPEEFQECRMTYT